MKTVLKIGLRVLRAVLLAVLLFSIYMLYLYHKEGYQVVLYNMGEGYKVAWTTLPGVYEVGASFCRSVTVLITAVPFVVIYWIVALIIGDTIRALNVRAVSDRLIKKTINDDLIAQIVLEREAKERAKENKERAEKLGVVDEGGSVDESASKKIVSTPTKRLADASKTYVSAGAMGRQMLDAKHADAPDIFEDNVTVQQPTTKVVGLRS